jgi:hypothetical protein
VVGMEQHGLFVLSEKTEMNAVRGLILIMCVCAGTLGHACVLGWDGHCEWKILHAH